MPLVNGDGLLRSPKPVVCGGEVVEDAEDHGLVDGSAVPKWDAVRVRQEPLVSQLRRRVGVGLRQNTRREPGNQQCRHGRQHGRALHEAPCHSRQTGGG